MLVLSGIRFMYFTIFTFAYLRHTNKQDGAKEESSLDNKMYIRVRQ